MVGRGKIVPATVRNDSGCSVGSRVGSTIDSDSFKSFTIFLILAFFSMILAISASLVLETSSNSLLNVSLM